MTRPLPRAIVAIVRRAVRSELARDVIDELDARWQASATWWTGLCAVLPIALGLWWHARRDHDAEAVTLPRRRLLPSIVDDVRMAVKSVIRQPRLSAAAAVTLALGIAASTAILTGGQSVFEASLPYPDSARLAHFYAAWPGGFGNLSYPDVEAMRAAVPALDDLAGYETWGTIALGGGGRPMSLAPTFVSDRYFQMLGASAELGRLFEPAEFRPGAPGVVVLSDGLWKQRFGGDPGVIGTTIVLTRQPFRVIGVMSPSFQSLFEVGDVPAPALWLPVDAAEHLLGQAPLTEVTRLFWALGHLAPGRTVDQLQQQIDVVAQTMAAERPRTHRGYLLKAQPLVDYLNGGLARPARILAAAALLMLVVGGANVANLLLTRAAERRGEQAMRAALGASRVELVRQAIAEGAVIAIAGGMVGVAVAVALVHGLNSFILTNVSPFVRPGGGRASIAVASVLVVLTAIGLSVAPALAAARTDLAVVTRMTGRGGVGGRHAGRSALVVCEVALTVVLLVGVGLIGRSWRQLVTSGLGFPTERLLTFRIDLTGPRYATDEARIQFARAFVERVGAAADVESATLWGPSMLGQATWVTSVLPEDRPWDRPDAFVQGSFHLTSPDGLHHLGIRLLAGRDITASDLATSLPVAILSQSFVRRFWPDAPVSAVLGRRLRRALAPQSFWTVVGVAADARHRQRYSLGDIADGIGALGLGPQRDLYLPYPQRPVHSFTVAVRARDVEAAVPAVRRAIGSIDPDLPVDNVRTLDDRLAEQNRSLAGVAAVMAVFAVIAAMLAAVGLYATLASVVQQRTREIGVRMALGAGRTSVVRLMALRGGNLVVSGLALGLALSAALSYSVRAVLYGVAPLDPATFAVAALGVLAMTPFALLLPVIRAANVDPLVALRDQ